MELVYCNNITKDTADIFVYGEIGTAINAMSFVSELNYLTDYLQIPQINVRINSPGGSVLDAMGIFAAILNSKANVDTYNDGIAASAGGFIAMAGKKRYMISHGQLMMHNVSGGDENDSKAENARQALTDSIATILSNNSGMEKDEIKALMNRETWMGAEEALQNKFIDGIYKNTPKRMMRNEVMASLIALPTKATPPALAAIPSL